MQREDHSTSQCGPLTNTKCQKYYIQNNSHDSKPHHHWICGDDKQ